MFETYLTWLNKPEYFLRPGQIPARLRALRTGPRKTFDSASLAWRPAMQFRRMKRAIRRMLEKSGLGSPILRFRDRRFQRKFAARHGIPEMVEQWTGKYGWTVRAGPFAGMQYVSQARGSVLLPKLIGSYEAELHPALNQAISINYDTLIDAGCAEGYYAIGLARRIPRARVFAYDIDPSAQKLCRKMAAANGVEHRVTVLGRCDPPELERRLRGRTLILSDCEGYEFTLLDPRLVPSLWRTDLLVELHGEPTPLLERFSATHQITTMHDVPRTMSDYPEAGFLNRPDVALSEFRPHPQVWAWMRAIHAIA